MILFIENTRALDYKQFISHLNIICDTLYWEFSCISLLAVYKPYEHYF